MTPNNDTSSPDAAISGIEHIADIAAKSGDVRDMAIVKFISVMQLLMAQNEHSKTVPHETKVDFLLEAVKMLDAACQRSVCEALIEGAQRGMSIEIGVAVFAMRTGSRLREHDERLANMAMLFADPNNRDEVAATTGPRMTAEDLRKVADGLKTGKSIADVVSEIAEAP